MGMFSFFKFFFFILLLYLANVAEVSAEYYHCHYYPDSPKEKTNIDRQFVRNMIVFYSATDLTVMDDNYSQKLDFIEKKLDAKHKEYLLYEKYKDSFLYSIKYYPSQKPILLVNRRNDFDNLNYPEVRFICEKPSNNNITQ